MGIANLCARLQGRLSRQKSSPTEHAAPTELWGASDAGSSQSESPALSVGTYSGEASPRIQQLLRKPEFQLPGVRKAASVQLPVLPARPRLAQEDSLQIKRLLQDPAMRLP
eukprot:TRINITY_DN2518_c0_g1_i1.p2 TRINITY_DN2518_c0_g1~~TRINITY_DN2518_c0_g1_i1.p2  ORF type:complete len:111 (+),score=18.11 TRINITY_DN2518_c0_g1_i1:53-385(+)